MIFHVPNRRLQTNDQRHEVSLGLVFGAEARVKRSPFARLIEREVEDLHFLQVFRGFVVSTVVGLRDEPFGMTQIDWQRVGGMRFLAG